MSKPGGKVIVLDTWAMMTFLDAEPAAQEVRQLLRRARGKEVLVLFSLINYGECLYVIEREHDEREVQRAIGIIDQLALHVIPADRSMVFEAVHIKACYPISYADAFSVALARRYRGRVMTGDPQFKAVEREVVIHWLPDRRSQMRLPAKTKIPKP